jgi:hypothetical protein
MFQRVLVEFIVEVPNMDVAGDVETRIGSEHTARLCDVLQSMTGFQPLMKPGQPGLYVASEPVTWNQAEQDWIGPDDGDDPDDDDDE